MYTWQPKAHWQWIILLSSVFLLDSFLWHLSSTFPFHHWVSYFSEKNQTDPYFFTHIPNYRLLAPGRSYAFPSLNQFKHGESIPVVAFFCHTDMLLNVSGYFVMGDCSIHFEKLRNQETNTEKISTTKSLSSNSNMMKHIRKIFYQIKNSEQN